ncbi:MAG: carboxypeptidase-like regulatory domain-containing protein [Vicinamibacterales bacterium]
MLLVASLVLWLLGDAQERATVTGVVRDELGQVLPGVTVTLDGTERVGQAVTDNSGGYLLADVPPGRYVLRATLPGFLVEGRTLDVSSPGAVSDVTLRVAPAAEVLQVVPPPQQAVLQADVIAHIRLRRKFDRRPCEGAGVVSTLFDADVLAVLKGAAPATLQMYQDGAGECVANGTTHSGLAERPQYPGHRTDRVPDLRWGALSPRRGRHVRVCGAARYRRDAGMARVAGSRHHRDVSTSSQTVDPMSGDGR